MFDDVIRANEDYAASFEDPGRPGRAGKGLAVVTCMDSRIDPNALLGLDLGDAKVMRNAGGRVTPDVVRSLVLAANLLGATRVAIIQHTQCAMAANSEADLVQKVEEASGQQVRDLEFLAMDDQLAAIRADAALLRDEPLLPDDLEIGAFLYDVSTGRLDPVDLDG